MTQRTSALAPNNNDTVIWDLWLSQFKLPIVTVAMEAGLFKAVSDAALTTEELAATCKVDARALAMFLAALAAEGFVEKRVGKWRATHEARTWLHPDATGYWGQFLKSINNNAHLNERLAESLRTGKRPTSIDARPAGWESGTMPQEVAEGIAKFMHAHSQAPALGAAAQAIFAELRCLIDVGCGSGIYGIEIAKANPSLQVILMDLKEVAAEAAKYASAANVGARVTVAGVNMFKEAWPSGADGHFFANIFHDWSDETNLEIAKLSFAALPKGGRIFLHEILVDDDYCGPYYAAAFSLLMLTGTLGKQYSLAEFKVLLESAGFVDVEAQRTGGGYYSLVTARKP